MNSLTGKKGSEEGKGGETALKESRVGFRVWGNRFHRKGARNLWVAIGQDNLPRRKEVSSRKTSKRKKKRTIALVKEGRKPAKSRV